jgi:hypothetical protein
MSFDEENLELEDASYSSSSVSRLSTHVTDAALVIENEIKGNYLSPGLKVFGWALGKLCLDVSVCCKIKICGCIEYESTTIILD